MANTFKRKLSKITTTAATTVGAYIVGASTTTTIIGLSIANISASPITVDVMLNDGSTDYYLQKGGEILVGDALVVVGMDQKVILLSGDSIKVQSSAANAADVIMSILELTA